MFWYIPLYYHDILAPHARILGFIGGNWGSSYIFRFSDVFLEAFQQNPRGLKSYVHRCAGQSILRPHAHPSSTSPTSEHTTAAATEPAATAPEQQRTVRKHVRDAGTRLGKLRFSIFRTKPNVYIEPPPRVFLAENTFLGSVLNPHGLSLFDLNMWLVGNTWFCKVYKNLK